MVVQPKIIALSIGVTRVEFCIRRSLKGIDLNDSADVAIAMTTDAVGPRFESFPTIVALKDLYRFGEYIDAAMVNEPEYEFVPMNLGFEFFAYDNDDYLTAVRLFLLSAVPESESRSYVGCRGPVLNEVLFRFANELKEAAMS